MRDEASELDRALSAGNGTSGTDPLVDVARELRATFDAPPPSSARERALFVEGVAAQRPRRSWFLLAAPAMALGAMFVLFLALAGKALPGDSLYAVREVMGSVGLARPAVSDIREVIDEASRLVTAARRDADEHPARARREAISALGRLGVARELLRNLNHGGRASLLSDIARIENQATAALWLASEDAERHEERAERIEERQEDRQEADEDSSGSGSGDEDSDDSSGSGSGDEDSDDSSGSGSGDDDSSGSGSEDDGDSSGSGDDSSGSGSGGDDSSGSGDDGDSSGSGSGGDSSGSGSGDDLDEIELDDDHSGPGGEED